jgi:hypothetical protein
MDDEVSSAFSQYRRFCTNDSHPQHQFPNIEHMIQDRSCKQIHLSMMVLISTFVNPVPSGDYTFLFVETVTLLHKFLLNAVAPGSYTKITLSYNILSLQGNICHTIGPAIHIEKLGDAQGEFYANLLFEIQNQLLSENSAAAGISGLTVQVYTDKPFLKDKDQGKVSTSINDIHKFIEQ